MASFSPESTDEPRAIPILTFEENSIKLDRDALDSIFHNSQIQDKPLCIVSISGAFRKGKSFMMNFFIRYLRNKGYDNSCWMGNDNVSLNEGLEWKGGMAACTKGILVWSEVFTAKKNGEEVAILLLDTQGLFDNKSDNKTNSIIFALSTLISSVQIFNLTQQIQERDLGFLQFFTAYAQAAKETSSSPNLKPFQSLLFVVRDWPYAEEFQYGMDGGEAYLAEVLKDESTTEDLSSVRSFLTSSFESTKCCLMPHPGLEVATSSNDFTGCLRDIKEDFVIHTAQFVDNLFKPSNLIVKTINGKIVSTLVLLQYIVDCGNSLTHGKTPNPKTMMENVADAQNFEAQRQCVEKYRQNMLELLGNSFVDKDSLCDMHGNALMGALKAFADMTRFGSQESRMKYHNYLQSVIDREYGLLAQVNRSKKIEAENRMLKVIEGIADKYEQKLKASTEQSKFLSELELQKKLETSERKAFEEYAATKDANPQLHDKYLQRIQIMIERIQKNVKSENEERKKIAEEQDKVKKQLLKLELECAIQYEERMRKLVKHYIEETNLGYLNDGERRTIVDEFQIDALDIMASICTETLNDHLASLNSKLDEKFKQICQINEEKKVLLKKNLESDRIRLIMDYCETFGKLLNDNYLEKQTLKKKHDEFVHNFTLTMRLNFDADARRIPIVAQHLEEVKNMLNSKYVMMEKWNATNNTHFNKYFKEAKKVIGPLVRIAYSGLEARLRYQTPETRPQSHTAQNSSSSQFKPDSVASDNAIHQPSQNSKCQSDHNIPAGHETSV